jgi:outer membrane protein assembly factor BamA/autotransporter translocation and assembly factor TamB
VSAQSDDLHRDPPRRARRVLRWLVRLLVAAVIASLALVGVIHLAQVRAWVLGRTTRWLASHGVLLQASSLDYNLFTLSAHLSNVTVSTTRTPDQPFLKARQVEANLLWASLWGPVHLGTIRVVGPQVALATDGKGHWNLPAGGGRRPGSGPALLLDRAVLEDLTFSLRDPGRHFVLHLGRTQVELDRDPVRGLEGQLHFDAPGALSVGGWGTALARGSASFVLDWPHVTLHSFSATTREGTASASGTLALNASEPLNLSVNASVETLPALRDFGWDVDIAGPLTASGRVTGSWSALRAAITATSPALRLGPLAPGKTSASVVATRDGVDVLSATTGAAWGQLRARGRIAGAASGGSALDVSWTGMDLQALRTAGLMPLGPWATQASGAGTLAWRGDFLDTLRARATLQLRPAGRSGLALAGSGKFRIAERRWEFEHDLSTPSAVTVRGTARGRLTSGPLSHGTLEGDTTVTSPSLVAAIDVAGIYGAPALEFLTERLSGPAEAAVRLGGKLGDPSADVSFVLPRLDIAGVGTGRATGRAIVTRDTQRFEDVTLAVANTRMSADGITHDPAGTLTGDVTLETDDVGPLVGWVWPEWRRLAAGRGSATGRLSGTWSRWQIDGRFSGGPLSIAGQDLDRVNTGYSASETRVQLTDIQGTRTGGALNADFTFLPESDQYQIRARVDRMPIVPCESATDRTCVVALPISGRASGEISGSGTWTRPGVQGRLTLQDARWGSLALGQVDVEADLRDGDGRFAGNLPGWHVAFDGTVARLDDTQHVELGVRGTDVDVAAMLRRAGNAALADRVNGTLSGSLHFAGDPLKPADGTWTADLQPATLAVSPTAGAQPVALRLVQPAHAEVTPDRLRIDAFHAEVGSARLTGGGSVSAAPGDQLEVTLEGEARDLVQIASSITPLPVEATAGHVALTGRLAGTRQAPTVLASARVDDATLTVDGQTLTAIALQARLDRDWLTLDRATMSSFGMRLETSGRVPAAWLRNLVAPDAWQTAPVADRASLRGTISGDLGVLLAERVPRGTTASGALEGAFDLQATALEPDAVTGALTVSKAALAVGAASVAQVSEAHLAIDRGVVTLSPWQLHGPATDLKLAGSLSLQAEPALDVQVSGPFGLAPFQPLVGMPLAGAIVSDLRITGPVGAPQVDGSVRFQGAALRFEPPRVAVSELNGSVYFEHGRAFADDVTASANGAPVLVRGYYDLTGATPPSLSVTTLSLPIQLVATGPRLELDADLLLTRRNQQPVITGRIDVLPFPFQGSVLALRRVVEELQAAYSGRGGGGGGRRRQRARQPVALDIDLITRESMTIDSNVGQVSLDAKLKIAGTLNDPGLLGAVHLGEGGELRAGGRRYRIERGTITFANPNEIEPVLNITANTRIASYDITLIVTGQPTALRTSLRSDPPLAETDLRSLLVTGRLASETESRGDMVDQQRLVESLSSDLFGFAARAVGLDTVSIGVPDFELIAGGIDASTSLNISKSISRQIQVVFSQDLEDNTYSWLLIFRPLRSTSFRVLSRENRDGAIEVRQELTFGGQARARSTAAAGPTRRTIESVTISGSIGFPESVIQDRLGLRAGQTFDPLRWQRATTRLQQFYTESGYKLAQIRPRRIVEGDTVRLEFEITRGPRTSLTVQGHEFPNSVHRQMDRAWEGAVTPEFLIDDLRQIARNHLIDDGFLMPDVQVSIAENTPERLELLMQVEPGEASTARQILFTGNRMASSEELLQVVQAAGLTASVWYDPETINRPILSFYRSHGHFDATVEAGEIHVRDGIGELPVTIDEGPQYRIAAIGFSGVHAYSHATLKADAQLEVGAGVDIAAVRAARERIQARYFEDGFIDADVRVQPRIDRDAKTVSPIFAVTEGSRRIVRDLRIVGNEVTRTKTISDFAQLESGIPVTPGLVSDLQKRLYDTGVFSSVAVDFVPVPQPAAATPAAAANGQAEAPTVPPNEAQVITQLTVEEAPRYTFRYGLQMSRSLEATGTSNTYAPGAGADFRDRNLFGRAIAAGVSARGDRRDHSLQGLLGMQRTFGHAIRSNLFLTARHEGDDRIDTLTSSQEESVRLDDNTVRVTAEQRVRPYRLVEMAWAIAYEDRRETVFHRQTGEQLFRIAGHTLGPRASIVWDSRNNPFDAVRGHFDSFAVDLGFRAIGSDLTYTRLLAQHLHFFPVGPVTLASGLRFGSLFIHGDDAPISLNLRFKAGGSHSVRGYRQDVLGPDFFGIPLGNNQLVVLNEEVRFPIWRWFKGVVFVDAGNTFPRLSDVRLDQLKVGTGGGLRLATPVGLFRVDLGYPVNDDGNHTALWYFSIGQAF